MRPKLFAITHRIDGDGLLEQPEKFHTVLIYQYYQITHKENILFIH
jgi:hypothetical protein